MRSMFGLVRAMIAVAAQVVGAQRVDVDVEQAHRRLSVHSGQHPARGPRALRTTLRCAPPAPTKT